jgi:iron(III) transport system substrate-binding protein
MEAIYREKLLQEVRSPNFKDLNPAVLPAHKAWAGIYVNVFVQAYNTNKVKKEELPKTYLDLLDPKWKGRLGMEEKSQEWFYALLKDMGEEKGLKFFRDLIATNKPTVRSGNNVINSMVVAGEVPFAMSGYLHLAEPAKRKGAPLDWIALDPVLATYNGVGISKKAPHSAAALLFYDFMLTDAQTLFVKMVRGTVNRKVESPIKGMKIKLLDPAEGLDEYDKATKLYENVLSGK